MRSVCLRSNFHNVMRTCVLSDAGLCSVCLWWLDPKRRNTVENIFKLRGHDRRVTHCTFGGCKRTDGRPYHALSAQALSVRVWDLDRGEVLRIIKPGGDAQIQISHCAFNPTQDVVSSADAQTHRYHRYHHHNQYSGAISQGPPRVFRF
eukprot:SAG11_NODE_457_length_9306_cov_2.887803_4_plen_149_part_00